MTPPAMTLLDERASPPLRQRVGRLLAGADDAAFAVARIRLAVLDLTDEELASLRRCRVLLGHLDAAALLDASDAAGAPGRAAPAMARLLRFARGGRLEVRSAGLGGWAPDFAVVRRGEEGIGVVGSIQFGNPELIVGPAFTVVTPASGMVALLEARFDELWERSHDVLPAIRQVLERASGVDGAAARGRGGNDPGRPVRG